MVLDVEIRSDGKLIRAEHEIIRRLCFFLGVKAVIHTEGGRAASLMYP